MLKKQHILLGVLFLGVPVKPMENTLLLGGLGVATVGTAAVLGIKKGLEKYSHVSRIQNDLLNSNVVFYPEECSFPTLCNAIYYRYVSKLYRHTIRFRQNRLCFGMITSGEKQLDLKKRLIPISEICEKIVKKYTPSKWNIWWHGQRAYNPIDTNTLHNVIEKNKPTYQETKFDGDLVFGLLESTRGKCENVTDILHLAKQHKTDDGLSRFHILLAKEYTFKELLPSGTNEFVDKVDSIEIKNDDECIVVARFNTTERDKNKDFNENIFENIRRTLRQGQSYTSTRIAEHCLDGIPAVGVREAIVVELKRHDSD